MLLTSQFDERTSARNITDIFKVYLHAAKTVSVPGKRIIVQDELSYLSCMHVKDPNINHYAVDLFL